MTTEDAIREARRRWGSGYASDRYWRDGYAAASRFMVTDCKQIYGLSGKSFEDAFADAEKKGTGKRGVEMRAIIDAAPKPGTMKCPQFSPTVIGSDICKCGHVLYAHYMCGDPRESACLSCGKVTPNEEPKP